MTITWRVEYDDSPGESWSEWTTYDEYDVEEHARDCVQVLVERRKGHDTVLRIVEVHATVTETVVLDTSVKPALIDEDPA